MSRDEPLPHVIPATVWKHVNTALIDFDGTLVNSYPRLFSAYKRFMELNAKPATYDDFKELIGYTLAEIVEKVIHKHQLKSAPAQLIDSYQSIMKQVYQFEIHLYQGAVETLELLKRHNIALALVTAADRSLVEPYLEKQQIAHYFQEIVTPLPDMAGKPAPDLYLHALDLMQVDATQAIALEDSPSGIASATSAGIYTILIRNTFHEKLHKDYDNVSEADNWTEVASMLSLLTKESR